MRVLLWMVYNIKVLTKHMRCFGKWSYFNIHVHEQMAGRRQTAHLHVHIPETEQGNREIIGMDQGLRAPAKSNDF